MAIEDDIKRLVRPEIRALKAYGVADPGDLVKLDAMENPYPWPDDIKLQWLQRLSKVEVNRYPDPVARGLRSGLRESMGIPRSVEFMLGNGSDELIQIVMMALALPGAKVLAPVPTFVMYDMTARFTGMEFIGVPLHEDDLTLDREAMLKAIDDHQPAVTFLAYPNNPTGALFSRDAMLDIIKATSGLVVVDEAYHAFAGRTFMGEIEEHDNVLVMRTVSKLGLAGLRLGLLAGPAAWLQEFNKVRLPYNINSLTQASAEFILANREFLEQQTGTIRAERTRVFDALSVMDGIHCWHSDANFILFRVTERSAGQVHEGLKRAGILIKNLDGSHPLLNGCLRVTIGLPEENDAFLKALADVLGATGPA